MATRVRIGLEYTNGAIISAVCHNGGSPEFFGKMLLNRFQNSVAVLSLIEDGDMSSISYDMNDLQPAKRIRGVPCPGIQRSASAAHFENQADEADNTIEFVYLFSSKLGIWEVLGGGDDCVSLLERDQSLDWHELDTLV